MRKYTPSEIEPKWQKVWDETKIYEVTEDSDKQKIYATPMLPYPSGAGLHVGHVRNYSIADVVARFYRQRGYNVMSNMGWDSFGLPAENYAIKTGTPPAKSTADNIKNFKNQLQRLGMSYDWSRELNTSDPEYYKWTQWLFNQFFNDDLAYQAENLQWWCTKCKTVLANEQVVNGKCWRHEDKDDPLVEKRRTNQWFFKITEYADELLEQIPNLDWPEGITSQQHNWIGRSVGAEIDFKIDGSDEAITVFTTRADTLYGATFMVLAPENELVEQIVTDQQKSAVKKYVTESVRKSDIDRMDVGKEKTGVFTGAYAINPAKQEKIPIWVGDFVLGGYGTGAIMAVPGHDQRDFEFAKKFELPITQVFMESGDDPANPPQSGFNMVERETVVVHLKDLSTGKYALLNWHGTLEGITTAVMGGVDEGETPQEAALKEIAEEVGLEKVKVVNTARWISAANYCASHKKQNRKSISTAVYAEVENLDGQLAVSEHESNTHTLVWLEKEEVESALTPVNQKQIWNYLQEDCALLGEGEVINSGKYNRLSTSEAREKIVADLKKKGVAEEKVNYRMRDWLISRQRYWGAPIPIIHCDDCGAVPVPDKDLPVVLPEVKDYAPTGEDTSVLASVTDWVNVNCPECEKPAKRETDTMDGYVCSSWYMYRYTDANNDGMAWDPEKVNYWFPIDFYFGADHAVAHLLYFRFWNHFFASKGFIDKEYLEPVKKLVFNGYINAEDGSKMSKSKGNVVDPLDIIDSGYGADALRLFELFVGPYDQDVVWNPNGVPGTYRFLQRVWSLSMELLGTQPADDAKPDPEKIVLLATATHKTIKKVTHDLENMRFNTAISACMELVNTLNKLKIELPISQAHTEWKTALSQLLQLLAPFAPHMAEEVWTEIGHEESVHISGWPVWDEDLVTDELVTIVVQVNGKVRANIEMPAGSEQDDVERLAKADQNVTKYTDEKDIKKTIYVKDRLISFVVG